jgi:hypothetical protein
MHLISTGTPYESPMNSRRCHMAVDVQALIFVIFALTSLLPS